MWPTVPGTTAGWAASGLAASCAVPAGGVAVAAAGAGALAGGVAGAWAAAAGVSPAAAKAIAHPINLIISPDVLGTGSAVAQPILAVSISAAFGTLKQFIREGG
jgi:hypothetical protein